MPGEVVVQLYQPLYKKKSAKTPKAKSPKAKSLKNRPKLAKARG
jgi:hypothetical protein